ncbi:uncharacterized protein [Triticum aestivum]|uniref:uncharacterized protein n=1 Tax=Triticum aestivum TaxID=4565 RepID=UPI001D01CD2F|nr:uncharacterized protein LOC123190801 [Triticum aestivum]
MELVGLVPTPSSGRRGTSSSPSSASSSAYGPGRSTHAAAVLRLRPAADNGARTLPLLTRATVPSRTHSLARLPQAMAWLPASHAFAGSAMVRMASPFRLAAAGARLLPLRRRRSGFSRHRQQVQTRCTPAEAEAAGFTRKKQPAPISKGGLTCGSGFGQSYRENWCIHLPEVKPAAADARGLDRRGHYCPALRQVCIQDCQRCQRHCGIGDVHHQTVHG